MSKWKSKAVSRGTDNPMPKRKKKERTYKQWSKTKITTEKTIDWATRIIGCWTVALIFIMFIGFCFVFFNSVFFPTIYKYRIDSGRSLHLHRFIQILRVEIYKVLRNRFYLFDELHKCDYSTRKARPQLESEFHKFTNGWNP